MVSYKLRFMFDHGGFCVWGMNEDAQARFGYAIPNNALPITDSLLTELDVLEHEYGTYLDWEYPPNPSPWSKNQKVTFLHRATKAYKRLQEELGSDFIVSNELDLSVSLND